MKQAALKWEYIPKKDNRQGFLLPRDLEAVKTTVD